MERKYYRIVLLDDKGEKRILLITVDGRIKHIYTITLTSDKLADRHPVFYNEKIDRAKNRLKSRRNTLMKCIDKKDALALAYLASRTAVAVSILKKMRSYRRKEEDLKNEQKPTSSKNK